jgi:hypothetical protein
MKKFLTNKYTISCIIVLMVVTVDIVLHKGMSRVMLPASFTQQRGVLRPQRCPQPLLNINKQWIKGVNTIVQLAAIDSSTAGIEMDVYYDEVANRLFVYHDSAAISTVGIETLLEIWTQKNKMGCIWLDFKNLSVQNKYTSLQYIVALRDRYQLTQKIIVESSDPSSLDVFCSKGFFTSYYVPNFNPYTSSESEILRSIDDMASLLQQHQVSALSGYYFQYPFLKKYFPDYPILTWTESSSISMVANYFNSNLLNDPQVAVVLFPQL